MSLPFLHLWNWDLYFSYWLIFLILLISIEQTYTYSEDKLSNGCMWGSYLVPGSGLSFASPNSVLCGVGIFNFIKTSLSLFSFIICFLQTVSGVSAHLKSWRLPPIFYSGSFIILPFIFISMTHLKLNFLVKFYPYYLWLFNWPNTTYWKNYFCTTNTVIFFSQNWWTHVCGSVSDLSLVFP